jgi:hypothetical protein
MRDQERISQIRARLSEERAIAIDLEGMFTQAPFKEKARRLEQQIREIEVTFLSDENLNRYRPSDVEDSFLASIEMAVDTMVTQERVRLESIMEIQGPDATYIGG